MLRSKPDIYLFTQQHFIRMPRYLKVRARYMSVIDMVLSASKGGLIMMSKLHNSLIRRSKVLPKVWTGELK